MASAQNNSVNRSYSEAYGNFERPTAATSYDIDASLRNFSLNHAHTDRRVSHGYKPAFKHDSIFYEPETSPPGAILSPAEDLEPVTNKPSKNSIFFEDFSVRPESKAVEASPETPSKNSIFYQDFNATLPALRSISTPVVPIVEQPKPRSSRSALKEKTLQISAKTFTEPKRMEISPVMSPHLMVKKVPSLAAVRDAIASEIKLHYVPLAKNLLGEGRYASVYSGTYTVGTDSSSSDQTVCAVKCLHPADQDAQANGVIEAFMLRKVQKWSEESGHKNIIRLVNVVEEHDKPSDESVVGNLVLALEFCPNGTLYDYVKKNPDVVGRRRWINWCKQLTSAVLFLHSNHPENDADFSIIHHDIKPQNILLDARLDVRLSDFGCASFVERERNTPEIPVYMDGLGRGTQAYSPPEILTPPDFQFSFATDIYALGCTFYFLLTGREPFADVRNAAHQLWCIRRGFWESGANPLQVPSELSTPPLQPIVPSMSLPQKLPDNNKNAPEIPSMALMSFLNRETLHADVDNDALAYEKIVCLLKKTTAVNPKERYSAQEVLNALNEIDDLLIPGTGFDDVDTRSRSKSRDRMRRTTLQISQSTSSDSTMSSIATSQISGTDELVVTRVPGGRRAVYL